jgi:hypothetical protein
MTDLPLRLTVSEHHDDHSRYQVNWDDGSQLICHIPEIWFRLIPQLAACALIEQGYSARRVLDVHVQGSDFALVCAPLGVVAAPPLLNYKNPVRHKTRRYGQRPERVQ